MNADRCLDSAWFRWSATLFFLISGLFLTGLMMLATPSFWYIPCALILAAGSPLWKWPRRGASFTLPPLVAFLIQFIVTDHLGWRSSGRCFLVFAFAAAVAFVLTAIPLALRGFSRRLLVGSLALVMVSLGVDRIFTGKIRTETVSVQWSVNGNVPWGQIALNDDGSAPVVIYEAFPGGGYCYDAINSPELKQRLVSSGLPTVQATYNKFIDFGRERGYNIGSVDGIVFNRGTKTVRAGWSEGGFVEGDGGNRANSCH